MSQRRLPWSDLEKRLLYKIWLENPLAQLSEITQDFNAQNHQVQPEAVTVESDRYRTEEAIKIQLKAIKKRFKQRDHRVATMTQATPSLTTVPITSPKRYTWVEMGLSVPRHPLIVEARMHASNIRDMAGSLDSSPMTQWPVELSSMDFSDLPCVDKDRVVVEEYLRCLANARHH